MKNLLCLLFCTAFLLYLTACGKAPESPENIEESICFDLSQYKDHGELSEGIIWVTKEVSDWDVEPYDCYAYLDCSGNVIYGWNNIKTYYNHNTYDCPATRPQNFKNGYALIYDQSGVDNLGGYADATIIDRTGSIVATFLIDAYESGNHIQMDYEHFNSQGYAFFIGKETSDSQYGMYFINSDGVHLFQCNENSYIAGNTLKDIDVVNQQYLYVSQSNHQLFDLDGKMLIDFQECSEILPDSIEIIDDKYIEATFTGKDHNIYVCLLNASGEIISSPVPKAQYARESALSSIRIDGAIDENSISSLSENINCVRVIDENGNGIENVLINVFYNNSVILTTTDETGIVDISILGIKNLADVSISILRAPESYKYNADEKYYFDNTNKLTIVLAQSA